MKIISKWVDYQDLIIIGGAPRSGTTLCQNILDSHPDVYGGPEFSHLTSIVDLRRKVSKSIERGYIEMYLSKQNVDIGLRELALSWIGPTAKAKGANRISEKSPNNALYLSELLDLFPQGYGLFVLRDPRAILASLLRVRQRYICMLRDLPQRLTSVDTIIELIKSHILAGLSAAEEKSKQVKVVRYEDLILRTKTEIISICQFINIDFDEKMLFPSNYYHDAEVLVRAGTPWYTMEEFCQNPNISRINAWKNELDSEKISALYYSFEEHKGLLKQFDYSW